MREIVKLMLVPIVGTIAIGVLFLLVVYGGKWGGVVYNEDGTYGFAVQDLEAYDGTLAITADCDANLYTPVCGADGNTYDNPCFAINAGTLVAYRGACGPR